MDISIITNVFDICNYEICLTHKELFSAIFGGMLTGISAIIIYIIQKRMETKTNKYNISTILHGEIKRIIKVAKVNENINSGNEQSRRLPSMEIYQGLLSSGNIKYFSSDLQDKLDEMYTYFKEAPLNPNLNLGINIMSTLEKMIHANRNYRIIMGFSKLNSIKHKN